MAGAAHPIQVEQTRQFATWFATLRNKRAKAAILNRIDRLALGNFGDVKAVGEGLSELRIHHGPGYRLYFVRSGRQLILLLCGGDKSSQRADIARARDIAAEWETRDAD